MPSTVESSKVLVVKTLLDARLGRLFAHFVVFVGGSLHIIHGGLLGPAEAWHDHLRQADIFRPGDARCLIFPEFVDAEVRTHASDAGIAQNFPQFRAVVFGEAAESGVGVPTGEQSSMV